MLVYFLKRQKVVNGKMRFGL